MTRQCSLVWFWWHITTVWGQIYLWFFVNNMDIFWGWTFGVSYFCNLKFFCLLRTFSRWKTSCCLVINASANQIHIKRTISCTLQKWWFLNRRKWTSSHSKSTLLILKILVFCRFNCLSILRFFGIQILFIWTQMSWKGWINDRLTIYSNLFHMC